MRPQLALFSFKIDHFHPSNRRNKGDLDSTCNKNPRLVHLSNLRKALIINFLTRSIVKCADEILKTRCEKMRFHSRDYDVFRRIAKISFLVT